MYKNYVLDVCAKYVNYMVKKSVQANLFTEIK